MHCKKKHYLGLTQQNEFLKSINESYQNLRNPACREKRDHKQALVFLAAAQAATPWPRHGPFVGSPYQKAEAAARAPDARFSPCQKHKWCEVPPFVAAGITCPALVRRRAHPSPTRAVHV